MNAYDDAVSLCRDLGIPEDDIDEVIEGVELCCGPYGDGDCSYDAKAQIEAAADKFAERALLRMNGVTK